MFRPLLTPMLLPSLLMAQGLRMPEVRVSSGGEPVSIQSLSIDVQVVGAIATTTWELTVYNPQSRVLEGEMIFPLGHGQTVSRFALDIAGKLREGVVVDKDKGRQVFEAIVRRGVDPGLLEKTAGNAFRARVYPVPARGTRRILLAYEQELESTAKGDLRYSLPFAFTKPIPQFRFSVKVHEQDADPVVTGAPLPGLSFKGWARALVAQQQGADVRLERTFSMDIPQNPQASAVFFERAPEATYFAVRVDPQLPSRPKTAPKHVMLLVDASASAQFSQRSRELKLLERYLRHMETRSVDLVLFRDKADVPRRFELGEDGLPALLETIRKAPLDGASAYGSLNLQTRVADEVILLGDGLNTLGPVKPLLPAAPLMALSSSTIHGGARLEAWAGRNGGGWIDLTQRTDAEAWTAMTTELPGFVALLEGREGLSDCYPASGQVLRGSFILSGRLQKPGATVTLGFGYGGKVTTTRTVRLDKAEGSEAPVRRLWAQKRLAHLSLDPCANARDIRTLGQAFGLVTEGTSLIVLEEVADYVRYRITPPEELRPAYDTWIKQVGQQQQAQQRNHLEQVLQAFQERQTWWKKDFTDQWAWKEAPRREAKKMAGGVAGGVMAESLSMDRSQASFYKAEMTAQAASLAPPPLASPAPARAADIRPLAEREDREKGSRQASRTTGTIQLTAWNPETPYLKELASVSRSQRYSTYLQLRKTHGQTPGFFLDVADTFEKDGDHTLARRILSNLAELKLEDPALLRVLGWRLAQLKERRLAAWVLSEVLRLREDEPQSRRDLALVLADKGEPQRAADLLWHVVRTPSDGRFPDIHLIALGELNALMARHSVRPTGFDDRFKASLPVDVRVVLNWDTPESDMDLHVIDPKGETCYFSHNRTRIGGRMSADVTQGFGPEEFLLKKAMPGTYRVMANFFGTRQQTVVGATTVRLELFLHHGTPQEQNKGSLVRLTGQSRMVEIGTFVVE